MRHDVQLCAVHGHDLQLGLQREAARRHRLPGLGIVWNGDLELIET